MKLRPLVARSRGLAAAAVAALALGIGLTTLMFAIVDGTVRRGLPAPSPGDIVHLERAAPPGGDGRALFLVSELAAMREQESLAVLAAYRPTETNLTGDGLTPRRWSTALVTPSTFEVLDARAAIGRTLPAAGDGDTGGVTPIVIGDTVWREQFGAEASAVGRAVRVNGVPAVVVGVMPAAFRFPINQHVWLPLDERTPAMAVFLWGRLAPGVSAGAAAGALTARYAQLPQPAGAGAAPAARVNVAPFTASILASIVPVLDAMFIAGLAVLVIACANAANLLLARGLARRREFAIATALGASRARMVRDRLGEALLLAAPGAVIGVALAYAGAAAFNAAIAASSPPFWVHVAIDARVLAYVVAITVLTALAAAAVPALRGGMAPPSTALAEDTRSTTSGTLRRTTAALVVVEIALSAAVLVCAGLMGKGVLRMTSAEFAFAVDDVLTGRIALPARTYGTDDARREFFLALHTRLDQLRASPAAALGSSLPFTAAESTRFSLGGEGDDASRWPPARLVLVSPGYFEALGVAAIGGRDFEESDRETRAPVAIVNLSFALTHARREDLIGRTIRVAGNAPVAATIVGVVPDLYVGNVRGEQPETIYLPLLQQQTLPQAVSVVARAGAPVASLERELRAAVAEIDPELPLDRAMLLSGVREQGTWFYRVFGLLFLSFGAGALVLALVGMYAVMSFAVTRRKREIGTRMALGATGGDIARMFLREGSVRLAAGLAAGVVLAVYFAPRLSLFLFQVDPRDPSIFSGAAAIVGIVGIAACAVPALRAARHNPVESLRDE